MTTGSGAFVAIDRTHFLRRSSCNHSGGIEWTLVSKSAVATRFGWVGISTTDTVSRICSALALPRPDRLNCRTVVLLLAMKVLWLVAERDELGVGGIGNRGITVRLASVWLLEPITITCNDNVPVGTPKIPASKLYNIGMSGSGGEALGQHAPRGIVANIESGVLATAW